MRHKHLLCILFSLLLFFAASFCGIWLNSRFPQLPSGSTLSPGNTAYGASLTGWQAAAPGRWQFTFTLTDASQPLAVCISGNSNDAVPEGLEPLRRNSDFYVLDPDTVQAGQPVQLCVLSSTAPQAWLLPAHDAWFWLQLRTGLQLVSLTAFVTMSIAILALFCFKPRHELGWFLLYITLMWLWDLAVLLSPASQNALHRTILRGFFSLAVLVPALLCSALTHTGTVQRGSAAEKRRGCLAVLWFVLSLSPVAAARIPALVLGMVGIFALLLYALAQGKLSALYLLLPYAATFGLRMLALFPRMELPFYRESMLFYVLRCARIYDLPFALGCLIYVCRRFALQFDRTEQLAQELDARVTQRTRALQEETDARKSMMLNIFHDLRSPLFVVSSGLDTLAAAPESLPTLLPILQQRVNFVHTLTEDLFLAAKLEQKQILLNEDRALLDELAAAVCKGCQTEAAQKGVQLTVHTGTPLPVWGDQLRLQQIVQNLVTNAIHYTPPGGQITVACTAENGQARVKVTDTGCGIAPADQAAVFDRYFHTTANTKHDSTGLGLTIAQELARLHHGEITLQSEPGKGSCFTLCLPLLETD